MAPTSADLTLFDLEVDPTIAMRAGDQAVVQHSWCGTVVVWSPSRRGEPLGPCPACERPNDSWWEQTLPLAGLRKRGS